MLSSSEGSVKKMYPEESEKDAWKFCRPVLCVMCVAVCVYQLVQFLTLFFAYESRVVVDTSVIKLHPIPTLAICNHNRIQRSRFCEKYPDVCKQKISIGADSSIVDNMTSQERKFMAQDAASLFSECNGFLQNSNLENKTALCRLNNKFVFDGDYNCFMTQFGEESVQQSLNSFSIVINLQQKEYLVSGKTKAVRIYLINNDNIIVNKRLAHFTAHGGSFYRIKFTTTTVNRLPAPYNTACKKYGDQFEENCYTECIWKGFMDKCGCLPPSEGFIPFARLCLVQQAVSCRTFRKEIKKTCVQTCPTSCKSLIYEVDRGASMDWIHEKIDHEKHIKEGHVIIDVDLRGVFHATYRHLPKFQAREVFSYIGGYLGIWLGLSIPAIFQDVEDFRRYLLTNRPASVHKKKQTSRRVAHVISGMNPTVGIEFSSQHI